MHIEMAMSMFAFLLFLFASAIFIIYTGRFDHEQGIRSSPNNEISAMAISNRDLRARSGSIQDNIQRFEQAARDCCGGDATDKVSYHSYQLMYGTFLVPRIDFFHSTPSNHNKKFKFLEIGMGCLMGYGPGKSVLLWKYLLKNRGDIWMAEADKECVDKFVQDGHAKGFRIVTGDQADVPTLNRWVKETRGGFDVIIDDGGHLNHQILNSFHVLFNDALLPGGLYFIEDLQVGKDASSVEDTMASILQSWIDTLLIPGPSNPQLEQLRQKYPKPDAVEWVFCQREACVVGKKS